MDHTRRSASGKRPAAESPAAALAALAMARRNRFRGMTVPQYLAGLNGAVLPTIRQRIANLAGGRE